MSNSQQNFSVALVGSPNSGKTTLYNWITGSQFKTVNYPGSTVDYYKGVCADRYSCDLTFIDTPGAYSLYAKTPEEQVTANLLKANQAHNIQKVVVVVDGTHLARQLSLVEQVKNQGFSVVVAVTMQDILRKEGLSFNPKVIEEHFGVEVVQIDGLLGGGVVDLIEKCQQGHKVKFVDLPEWNESVQQVLVKSLKDVAKNALGKEERKLDLHQQSQKLDKVLLHPVLGGVIFTSVMVFLFSSIFWMAAPFMDIVDGFFGDSAAFVLDKFGENLSTDFLANGIIASFGAVLVFVPQIFILFLGIGFLEDSGYLARASAIVDKPLSLLGLNGRSFVPLLSGFACAVPAMMATRTIGSRREKWMTMYIIPFMTCSARLPVYALILSFVFVGEAAWKPGLALAGLYFGALFIGAIASALLNLFLKRSEDSFFVLEMPTYRMPRFMVIVKSALQRTKAYVMRAGPVIFVLALVIWVGTTFPAYDVEDTGQRLSQSYIGQAGRVIEPVFAPMGGDWRTGVGLISAFAAREVFVSSLAVIFNISEDLEEDAITESLLKKMRSAVRSDGSPLFTFASMMALLVFFMIALQCISTTAMAAKEMNSWSFAIIQLITMNVVAYIAAVIVFNILA